MVYTVEYGCAACGKLKPRDEFSVTQAAPSDMALLVCEECVNGRPTPTRRITVRPTSQRRKRRLSPEDTPKSKRKRDDAPPMNKIRVVPTMRTLPVFSPKKRTPMPPSARQTSMLSPKNKIPVPPALRRLPVRPPMNTVRGLPSMRRLPVLSPKNTVSASATMRRLRRRSPSNTMSVPSMQRIPVPPSENSATSSHDVVPSARRVGSLKPASPCRKDTFATFLRLRPIIGAASLAAQHAEPRPLSKRTVAQSNSDLSKRTVSRPSNDLPKRTVPQPRNDLFKCTVPQPSNNLPKRTVTQSSNGQLSDHPPSRAGSKSGIQTPQGIRCQASVTNGSQGGARRKIKDTGGTAGSRACVNSPQQQEGSTGRRRAADHAAAAAPSVHHGPTNSPTVRQVAAAAPSVHHGPTNSPTVRQVAAAAPSVHRGSTHSPIVRQVAAAAPSVHHGPTHSPTVRQVAAAAPSVHHGPTHSPTVRQVAAAARSVHYGPTHSPTVRQVAAAAPVSSHGNLPQEDPLLAKHFDFEEQRRLAACRRNSIENIDELLAKHFSAEQEKGSCSQTMPSTNGDGEQEGVPQPENARLETEDSGLLAELRRKNQLLKECYMANLGRRNSHLVEKLRVEVERSEFLLSEQVRTERRSDRPVHQEHLFGSLRGAGRQGAVTDIIYVSSEDDEPR